ncbi:tRNA (adenosine(37)-N6)-threonylcarbamoyltransferase complex transferase subunit TsaD [Culicoidibacter larvae]|uniref:tRNA N6-adenosine threonylcarbamoyltransferase n=1 Tax=Culicoidibacter larvae TaxID=2579976 RepID=A0A5R8QBI5_9FIRM|nr:tRNA (adenosine(37)-N6)-threonylcarbamoyltransferase complex transferase subunit TsaD [Culicoidibacter larvae]TLG73908.1 tRNA (adenosine(37)-N6)-threonylcarbamoyltransferase complex transferase subunit TsaD [Culicoidibacter larvae]
MRIFAIETSCDETSAAIIEDGVRVCSLVTTTQIAIHQKFGGVVPEVASRYHVEAITAVLAEALSEAKLKFEDIDAIAVTATPGLVGSLLVGIQAAKTLALLYDLPLIPVHHIAGHIYANALTQNFEFPLIALVVSGGHTELIYMKDHFDFELIGATLDDAAGEVYDKVARVLGYPYPGGPHIDRAAANNEATISFPKPKLESPYDFSFSGLKSAVLNYINSARQKGQALDNGDISASFQKIVIEELVGKTIRAAQAYGAKQVIVCGGVSANIGLRTQIESAVNQLSNVTLAMPELQYCGDNAAMIGAAAYYQYMQEIPLATMALDAKPNGKLS